MKFLKKVFAAFLLVCMVANLGTVCLASGTQFSDVALDAPARNYIIEMAQKGIIKGYSENIFAPEDTCTREQFLTFLWRASGSPEPEKVSVFTDVSGSEYFAKAVSWAYENGITKIYSDGSFGTGKPTDREHAVFYLYNWAKLYNKADTKKTVVLNGYEDRGELSTDSILPFAWAMHDGIIEAESDTILNPKGVINRAFAATAIGKLISRHMHDWSEWEDLGDGTHKRVCLSDNSHTEEGAHTWNYGELTKKPTDDKSGVITYTCTCCLLTKTETVAPGTEVVTRSDAEKAIANAAIAYAVKGDRVQYDSIEFSDLDDYDGGNQRLTTDTPPEGVTEDSTFFSVCTNYVFQTYREALGRDLMDGRANVSYRSVITFDLFAHADNQLDTHYISGMVNDPITEDEVDACVLRWVNFDQAAEYYDKNYSRIRPFAGYGLFESDSFTDYTEGLTFKDDSFEGEYRYSYYDAEGNRISYDEARDNYAAPFVADYEKNMRPGDFFVHHSHTWLYIGNGRVFDCGGYKMKTATGVDVIEEGGAIYTHKDALWPLVPERQSKSVVLVRPTMFLAPEGYDEDLGNDIIPDLTIPEKSKSREKYPAMDIDRTADITPFGTVSKGDNITYTIKIKNSSNLEFYKDFLKGNKANESYENVLVTETIPEGSELVEGSISGDGEYKDGKITWNIKTIAPGETAHLNYTVKAVGEIGSVIVNDGGMVDNIPSNSISNKIGGEKLSEDAKAILSKMEALDNYGSDTDFAEAVYKELGESLSLPTVAEITEEFFTVEDFVRDKTNLMRALRNDIMKMYRHQTVTSGAYPEVEQMFVDRYWGGRRYLAKEEIMWKLSGNGIKEFKEGQLEAGDIIVSVKAKDKNNLSCEFDNVTVMIYDGARLLCSKKTPDGVVYEIVEKEEVLNELTRLYMTDKDLFFLLRPSQVKK